MILFIAFMGCGPGQKPTSRFIAKVKHGMFQ